MFWKGSWNFDKGRTIIFLGGGGVYVYGPLQTFIFEIQSIFGCKQFILSF